MQEQVFDSMRIYAEETQPLFVEVEVEVEKIPEDALACIAEYFQALAYENSGGHVASGEVDEVHPVEYLKRAHFHCHKILAVHYFEAADEMMRMFAGDDLAHVDNAQFIARRENLRNRAQDLISGFSGEESELQREYIRGDIAYFDNESLLERAASKDPKLRNAVEKSYEASKEYFKYVKKSIPKLNRNHFTRDRLRVLRTWQGRVGLVTFALGVLAIVCKLIAGGA